MSVNSTIRAAPKFTVAQAQGFLLARSGLLRPVKSSPEAVANLVRRLGGVRAEKMEWVHASLAARLGGYVAEHLDRSLFGDRMLLRLWGVRGAELIVHREDAPAQVGAAGTEALGWTRFLDANLSIDAARRREIVETVMPGPFSRSDVTRKFERYLHLTGKAPPSSVHQTIIKEAGARGQLLWCGGEGTSARYCSTVSWLGHALEPINAPTHLLQVYLSAFGPAPLQEAAVCLGLTVPATRSALHELDAVEVEIEGARPGWVLSEDLAALRKAPDPKDAPAFALPEQDPLLTAWPSRERLGPGLTALAQGGEASGTVWIDGRVIATWRREGDTAEVRPIGRSTPAPRQLAAAFAQGAPLLRPRLVR
jgi:hypothetical protein